MNQPLHLRALDMQRRGKNVVLRMVTDEGTVDYTLPRSHAATMATALTEFSHD